MSVHTPGPWTINGPWHIQAETPHAEYVEHGYAPKVVAHIVPGHGITPEAREANARLIAAAPEMLEALELISATTRDPMAKHYADGVIAKVEGKVHA